MVERQTVNLDVVGSNPTGAAIIPSVAAGGRKLLKVVSMDLKVKLLLMLFNIGFKSRAVGDLPVQIWGGSMGANNSM